MVAIGSSPELAQVVIKAVLIVARFLKCGSPLLGFSNAALLATSLFYLCIPRFHPIQAYFDPITALFVFIDVCTTTLYWREPVHLGDPSTTFWVGMMPSLVLGLSEPLMLRIRFPWACACIAAIYVMASFYIGVPPTEAVGAWVALAAFIFLGLQSNSVQMLTSLQLCKERVKLEREERRTGTLLANMLPPVASHRLKAGEKHIASQHKEVTILFAEIQVWLPALRTRVYRSRHAWCAFGESFLRTSRVLSLRILSP